MSVGSVFRGICFVSLPFTFCLFVIVIIIYDSVRENCVRFHGDERTGCTVIVCSIITSDLILYSINVIFYVVMLAWFELKMHYAPLNTEKVKVR